MIEITVIKKISFSTLWTPCIIENSDAFNERFSINLI